MYIKIGDMIINTDNVTRVMNVTGQRVEFEFNTPYGGAAGDEGYTEPFNICIIYTSPDYPQALAAYDWFCAAAIRFDMVDTPATRERDNGAAGDADFTQRIDNLEFAVTQAHAATLHPDHTPEYKLSEVVKWLRPYAVPGSGEPGSEGEPAYYLDSADGQWKIHRASDNKVIQEFASDLRYDAERTTITLNTQLAAATADAKAARERVADLAKQIDDAGYYLGQSSDRDENSNRAYNILKGYSTAD
jgi:hypothetical protein